MNRSERRRNRAKKIKERIRLLIAHSPTPMFRIQDSYLPKFSGMLANNNEVNHLMGAGKKRKTNGKKECASYRHHGSYGQAKHLTARDKRQKISMDQQENEFQLEGNYDYTR